ncbi:AAA family ATPase [Streptomyces olivaceus]|uniref:AAA family ATPase n=1 Tax=Streptomyces olivaceus TaxID=47716 RepID=UPI001CCBCE87|nr:AAA family ATPase [Streptomyces olivaceus]MBZ6232628.1 AAA family ATPase [Streptomyces olivaceus]
MTTPFEVSARAVHEAATILLDHTQDGLPFRRLWPLVLQAGPSLEDDFRAAAPGATRGLAISLGYTATSLVKAGWLCRKRPVWRLTGLGVQALAEYPEPVDFLSEAGERYMDWRRNREAFDAAAALLQLVPDMRWLDIEDLAAEYEVDAYTLASVFQGTRPDGWHLALDAEGTTVDVGITLLSNEIETWRNLLSEDRLLDEQYSSQDVVRALPGRKMTREEITALVLGETADDPVLPERPRRVWILRGTDEGGASLIRTLWREESVVSLDAGRMSPLPTGAGPQRVRKVVDDAYETMPAGRREELAKEVHTFVARIQDGDIVVCTDGPKGYIGVVRGPAVHQQGATVTYRRKVDWRNLDAPLDIVKDLGPSLLGRLGDADARIVDISEFASRLEALAGPHPVQEPPPVEFEPYLPDITQALVSELTQENAAWLQECVELLRAKPQLVFQGPPGTGKTFTALALARHLTGGTPGNVRLVQFHPAYSYEDFFEGIRPRLTDPGGAEAGGGKPGADSGSGDGSGVVFHLAKGPLRRLADAAERRPAEIFVLVIDEMTRGNLAKVFGELYFLLEYRKEYIHLQYGSDDGSGFRLPPNLFILGTMNTTDRSVSLMDAAMRRRFSFMELHPEVEPLNGMLERWLEDEGRSQDAARLLAELNRRIGDGPSGDQGFRIGPSYFMQPLAHGGRPALARLWRTQIIPLLTEFHWGDETDVAAEYGLDELLRHLGIDGDGEQDTDGPGGSGTP